MWQYMYKKRLNLDALVVISSVHNQRIKRLNRDVNTQIINNNFNFFTYIEEKDIIDPENEAYIFPFHCIFLPKINRKLSEFMLYQRPKICLPCSNTLQTFGFFNYNPQTFQELLI